MVLSFLQTSCLALLSGLLLIPFILGASFGIYKCLLIFKNRWNETARLDETSGKITNFFSFVDEHNAERQIFLIAILLIIQGIMIMSWKVWSSFSESKIKIDQAIVDFGKQKTK